SSCCPPSGRPPRAPRPDPRTLFSAPGRAFPTVTTRGPGGDEDRQRGEHHDEHDRDRRQHDYPLRGPDCDWSSENPAAAALTSGGKSANSCTWRTSITSLSEAWQRDAHSTASSFDFTWIIQ